MNGSRYPAFVAYLLGPLGWLYVGIFQRKNRFAVYHTLQAIGLLFFVGAIFIGWYVLAWLFSWIPVAGPTLGVMLFTLVITTLLVAVVLWVVGMSYALRGCRVPLPLIGRSIARLLAD